MERAYLSVPAKGEKGVTIISPFAMSELVLKQWQANYYISARRQRWNVRRPMYVAEAQRFFSPPTLRELQWAYFGTDEQGLPVCEDYHDELAELIKDLGIDGMLGEWTSSWVIDGKHLLERPRVTIHYAKEFLHLIGHLLEPPNCREVKGTQQAYILDFRENMPQKISGNPGAVVDAGGYLFVSAIYSLVFRFDKPEELEIPFTELKDGKVVRYTNQGFPANTASPRSRSFNMENMFNGNAKLIREGLTSTAVLHHSLMDPLSSFNVYSFLPYSGGEGIGVRRVKGVKVP